MSQPDDGRYKTRGRKERTPEQLKVLAMAREKAKLVIQERTKIKKELAGVEQPIEEPLTELHVEDSAPEPIEVPPTSAPEPIEVPPTPPPEPIKEPLAELPAKVSVPPSLSRDEIQNLIHSTLDERRPQERKYAFVDGMYVKIK
jgi:hypothetical protein